MIKIPIELISMNKLVDINIMNALTFPLGDQQQKEAIVNEMVSCSRVTPPLQLLAGGEKEEGNSDEPRIILDYQRSYPCSLKSKHSSFQIPTQNIMNKGGLETTKDQGLEDVDMNATIVLTTSNDSGDTFKDSEFNDEESGIAEVNEEREEMVTLGAWTRFFLYLLLLIHIAFIVLTIYDTITTFAPGRDEGKKNQ